MEARIPFAGFYESIWDHEIDRVGEMEAERLAEEHEITQAQAAELLWRYADYREAHKAIAKKYAEVFIDVINETYALDVKAEFVEMTSPKEYNFETDKVWIKISYEDVLKLIKAVGWEHVATAARQLFTSRDGFISFYRPDILEWGKIREWDYNQLYAVFVAAARDIEEWDFAEDLSETIFIATTNCYDWDKINTEIGKILGKREAEEENRPWFEFEIPPHAANTADYIHKFCELNHLKE